MPTGRPEIGPPTGSWQEPAKPAPVQTMECPLRWIKVLSAETLSPLWLTQTKSDMRVTFPETVSPHCNAKAVPLVASARTIDRSFKLFSSASIWRASWEIVTDGDAGNRILIE